MKFHDPIEPIVCAGGTNGFNEPLLVAFEQVLAPKEGSIPEDMSEDHRGHFPGIQAETCYELLPINDTFIELRTHLAEPLPTDIISIKLVVKSVVVPLAPWHRSRYVP